MKKLLISVLALLSVGCGSGISTKEEVDRTPVSISTATLTPTSTATATITPTETPTPIFTPVPTRVSEVHVAPSPVPVRGGNSGALQLPANTTVMTGGCTSDGFCYPYNFYWADTHEAVVVRPEESQIKVQHELCHAHQHWSIGRELAPSERDLAPWYATTEAQSFGAVSGNWPWGVVSLNNGLLEDFAWTCAFWYLDPDRLLRVGGPERYNWAKDNLP